MALALVAVGVLGVMACGSSRGSLSPRVEAADSPSLIAPIAGGSAPIPHDRLYRIVGCRSHGGSIYRNGPARHEVAIGFDDGPYPDTPAFVRMLERSHATGTFFMIGRQVTSTYRETMLHELRAGDVLGDHTFTHPDMTRSSDPRGELERTLAVIRAQTGYTPCVFRPPYGDVNAKVIRIASSLGLATVGWDVDPSDYAQPGTATIVHRVLAQVKPGAIIISHDGGGPRGQTLAAYPRIIAALHRRGYRVVTIPQLLGYHPVYEPCVKLCDGLGLPRTALPHGAIVQHAP
ncbi:MAG TPA: polysaccharide deacetylase family protein [Solirubrobacteraceae bacterium]|nr:polysaccharide deacetylase family protein [Solirubrobacteraceae bacterium]